MWNDSNFTRRRFIMRKAICLHPVLVLSPMLNIGCNLWGSVPHLHKYRFYWQKNDQCYNKFCISEHHIIYPAELFASVPQQENPFQLIRSPRLLQSLQPHARSLPYKYSAMHKLAIGLITRAEFNTLTNTEKAWWIPVLLLLNPDFLYECFTSTVFI